MPNVTFAPIYLLLISTPKFNWWRAMEECCEQWVRSTDVTDGTLTLLERPKGARVNRSKRVLSIKVRPKGSLRHKARWVIQGCTQIANVTNFILALRVTHFSFYILTWKKKQMGDNAETYSPVPKMTSIRCLLSIGAAEHLEMIQCDVFAALLQGFWTKISTCFDKKAMKPSISEPFFGSVSWIWDPASRIRLSVTSA